MNKIYKLHKTKRNGQNEINLVQLEVTMYKFGRMGGICRIYLFYTINTERIKQSTLLSVRLNVYIDKMMGKFELPIEIDFDNKEKNGVF